MGENEKSCLANPAALGLFGLSVAALAAAAEKLELVEVNSNLMPWVFFLGGLALIIAAIYEFRAGDTFAATFFGAFGLFWFAYGNPWWEVTAGWEGLEFVILGYFIFSIYMTYAAATMNMVKFAVLFFAMLTFAGLLMAAYWDYTLKFAGVAELFLAISGFYASAAILLKTLAGFDVLPVGKPLFQFKEIKL
jgi:succinate-acetate transporter protein